MFGAVAVPLAAVVVTLALGRMGGVAADRLALAAWRHHRSPRRLVPAPEGVPPVPAFFAGGALGHSNGRATDPRPSPLTLPLVAIGADGVVDLGSDGFAVLCRASAVSFSLRTATEQEALVAGFGRYLNSLSEPTQILIRAEPIDLGPMIADLERAAPALPHLGLEDAARAHARFLGELAATRDLLRREVLVVLRQRGGEGARARLLRRAEEATAALSAAGVTLALLAGDEASSCLGRALDPAGLPGPLIMGRGTGGSHGLDTVEVGRTARALRLRPTPTAQVTAHKREDGRERFTGHGSQQHGSPHSRRFGGGGERGVVSPRRLALRARRDRGRRPGGFGSATIGVPVSPSSGIRERWGWAGSSPSRPIPGDSISRSTSNRSRPSWRPTACGVRWPVSNRDAAPMRARVV